MNTKVGQVLRRAQEDLSSLGKQEVFRYVEHEFGSRGRRAVRDYLAGSKATKMPIADIYFIKGKSSYYTLVGYDFCSCEDFYMNDVLRGTATPCHHQLILLLCKTLRDDIRQASDAESRDLILHSFPLNQRITHAYQ